MKYKKTVLNISIISYLFLITIHAIPFDTLLLKKAKQITSPLVMGLGIWQGWNMFAPNPLRFDVNIYSRLVYKDGTVIVKNIEDHLDNNFLKPFREVRWTKWSKDNVRQDQFKILWKPTLRYMIDKYAEEGNPIVKAELFRRHMEVALLTKDDKKLVPLSEWNPKFSNESVFFTLPEKIN